MGSVFLRSTKVKYLDVEWCSDAVAAVKGDRDTVGAEMGD